MPFLRHLRVLVGRQLLPVRDDVNTGVDGALAALRRLDVAVDLRAALGRLAMKSLMSSTE